MKFDIDRKDLYEFDKSKDRTKKRLTEMAEIGMEEVGTAQFGVKHVMSGLYIEMVWSYSDEEFDSYMKFVKGLIFKKSLIPMVNFVFSINWLSTVEFCDTYKLTHPHWTGDVKTSAEKFVNLDIIKHKLFVEYAKMLNKKLTVEMFISKNPLILGFESVDVRGGNPKFKNGKYEITNDEFGFFLEPYDSVDGCRISRVEDLVNYGFSYNNLQ